MTWTKEELQKLKKHHEELLKEAEEKIETSSYPPDEQREIDVNQHIIWLINDMLSERSWIYRHCKS